MMSDIYVYWLIVMGQFTFGSYNVCKGDVEQSYDGCVDSTKCQLTDEALIRSQTHNTDDLTRCMETTV